MLNTKEKGTIKFLFYKKPGQKYVGVCLTFNIVEEGTNFQKLRDSVMSAAVGHLMVVNKEKLGNKLLNRPAPKRYWDMYYNALRREASKRQSKVFSEGYKIPISSCLLQGKMAAV